MFNVPFLFIVRIVSFIATVHLWSVVSLWTYFRIANLSKENEINLHLQGQSHITVIIFRDPKIFITEYQNPICGIMKNSVHSFETLQMNQNTMKRTHFMFYGRIPWYHHKRYHFRNYVHTSITEKCIVTIWMEWKNSVLHRQNRIISLYLYTIK